MGWNDWYQYECKVSDSIMRANADALVNTGMKAAGYIYVNIDDCWQGKRDEKGVIHPNERFPDMKALGDYLHSQGLKVRQSTRHPDPRLVEATRAATSTRSRTRRLTPSGVWTL